MTCTKKIMKYILIALAAAVSAAVVLIFAVKQPATAEDNTHQNHKVCVGSACTDSNHTNVEWTEWTGTTTLPAEGTYYLSDDVSLSSTIELTGDLTLCLNGHTISGSVTKFNVTNGHTLNICDCSAGESGKLTGATDDSAVIVNGGTFNLYGGEISENKIATGENGGGVKVQEQGTFNMYGGKIAGNSVSGVNAHGGGVYLDQKSIFNMYDGVIGGDSENLGNTALNGGGVYIQSISEFTMYGGTISNNKSTNSSTDGGGGVFVANKSTFIMNGNGVITENKASNDGGGVNVFPSGTFKMENGTISGNMAKKGGGVFSQASTNEGTPVKFEMNGGEISGNTASQNGGGVYVGFNVGKFDLKDGTISGNTAANGGVYVNQTGLTIDNFKISGNSAASNGGGVWVDQGALTINSGTVSENKAIGSGGGVYYSGMPAYFQISGTVKITGNRKTADIAVLSETDSNTDTDNNAYLCSGKTIKINNGFDAVNSEIGVTVENPPMNCRQSVQVTSNGTSGDEAGFTSDDEDCYVMFGNAVWLIGPHQWGNLEHDDENHWGSCSLCSENLEETPHVFDSGVVTTPATTTAAGVKTYTCGVCKYQKTENIPKLNNQGGTPSGGTPSGGGGTRPTESTPSESEPTESTPSESEPIESEPIESTPSESEPIESDSSTDESSSAPSEPSESTPTESSETPSESSDSAPSESDFSSDGSSSAPSESTPPISDNPATGMAVSMIPVALALAILVVATKRSDMKK